MLFYTKDKIDESGGPVIFVQRIDFGVNSRKNH